MLCCRLDDLFEGLRPAGIRHRESVGIELENAPHALIDDRLLALAIRSPVTAAANAIKIRSAGSVAPHEHAPLLAHAGQHDDRRSACPGRPPWANGGRSTAATHLVKAYDPERRYRRLTGSHGRSCRTCRRRRCPAPCGYLRSLPRRSGCGGRSACSGIQGPA